jgi:hypothetical protein
MDRLVGLGKIQPLGKLTFSPVAAAAAPLALGVLTSGGHRR